jgi:hypothetical protein
MATAAGVISCTSRTSDIGCRPAKPGCGARTTLDDSTYIEGCGQVCPDCAGGEGPSGGHRAGAGALLTTAR